MIRIEVIPAIGYDAAPCGRNIPGLYRPVRRGAVSAGTVSIGIMLLLAIDSTIAQTTAPTFVADTDQFEFHSDPWLNAHHFLYQWARADEGIGEERTRVNVMERSGISALSDADREIWLQALAYYRSAVAPLSHFDNSMLLQKVELLRVEGNLDANPAARLDGLVEQLTLAMPVYVKVWWADHDAANRKWVSDVLDPLTTIEHEFVDLTVKIYGAKWPADQRRIDVSAYANFRAGYTALGHTVIYSTDPGNQGLYGLETLLHEVQHTREVAGAARTDLRAAFAAVDLEVPQNLWHGIIFATAGTFVQSFAADRQSEHEPYWIREGFDNLAGWSTEVTAAYEFWLPVIQGDADRYASFTSLAQYYRRRDSPE